MMPVTSIFHIIFFILVQFIVFKATKSESLTPYTNVFDNSSLYKSGRSKRSLNDRAPIKLTLTVKHANDEEIHLTWVKYDQYLANEHLPVHIRHTNWEPNIMEDIGEFVVYYDLEKCSAVVYFEKLNSFYGVIGTDYYIENLPFNFNGENIYREIVTEPYIMRKDNSLLHIHPDKVIPPPSDVHAWEEYLRPYNFESNEVRKCPSDSEPGPSMEKRQRAHQELHVKYGEEQKNDEISLLSQKHKYYIETLIFVTRDIVDIFKQKYGQNDYVGWIIRYHIIYFNAVNMFFKQKQDHQKLLNINIAKILIENDMAQFNFLSNGQLQFTEVVAKLRQYLESYQFEHSPDSFDYVFIHTAFPIKDGSMQVNAITKSGMDVYESRKANHLYDAVPISIVSFKDSYSNYVVAIHEIGRVLNMKIDPKERGIIHGRQCYGMMQRGGPKCAHCLKWKAEYIVQFRAFFSHNKNRCFLINKPRSLRPPGPSKFVSPFRQCQCYGYLDYGRHPLGQPISAVRVTQCSIPLQCRIGINSYLSYKESSILPLEGTPCSSAKVCWNAQCVPSIKI